VELHPSPLIKFPSSQYAVNELNLFESPQISWQMSCVLGDPPDHEYPVSTIQVDEHPSPFAEFPSSQASLPILSPSPQIVEQTEGAPAHEYPASICQLCDHPSPLVLPPSSQVSPESVTPFQQVDEAKAIIIESSLDRSKYNFNMLLTIDI
jgi:hypothetical protein